MKIYVRMKDGTIDEFATFPFDGSTFVELTIPLDPEKIEGYSIDESKLVFDEDKFGSYTADMTYKKAIQDAEEKMDQSIREKILDAATDQEALKMLILYPEWNPNGVIYSKKKRIVYNGSLYSVLKKHESQPKFNPETATSLFAKVEVD